MIEPHAKPMEPMPEYIVHKDDSSIYPENVNEMGDRLDPADYSDLPFPDFEELAPAEEVEGAND